MTAPRRVWLVSYPKSGNTWFRFVLFFLSHGRPPETSRELDAFINAKLPPRPGDVYKKSHARVDFLLPHLGADDKIVYIYRHPLDVLQSALNYAALNGELSPGGANEWIDAYIEEGGHALWRESGFDAGRWAENVEGWLAHRGHPIHFIRYEDALVDLAHEVVGLAGFLGADASPSIIEGCVTATAFDELRRFEEEELSAAKKLQKPLGRFSVSARTAAAERGVRFFNRGAAEAYRETMSDDQIRRGWAVFGPMAEPLGYAP